MNSYNRVVILLLFSMGRARKQTGKENMAKKLLSKKHAAGVLPYSPNPRTLQLYFPTAP